MAGEPENESGNGIIAVASAGINVSNIFMRTAKTLGRRLSPAFMRTGAHLGNAASIAAIAYEVHSEAGLKHKTERAAAGLASAGLNFTLGSAAATAGETATLTGIAGATGATAVAAAAPVVLSVAAAAATAKMGELAIENHRAYEALDRDTAQDAAPRKLRNRADENTKPSIFDYKHMAAMRGVTARMRDDVLHASAPVERYVGSGRIKNLNVIDMTDPVNLEEYERALAAEIAHQQAVMTANDSLLPRWLRHGDAISQYNFAEGELQNLLGAKEELSRFREDVKVYHEHAAGTRSSTSVIAHDVTKSEKGKLVPGFNAATAGSEGEGATIRAPDGASVKPPPGRSLRPV